MAGASPNTATVRIEMSSVNASARASSVRSSGMAVPFPEASTSSTRLPHRARTRPTPTARSVRTSVSVRSRRTNRPRPAPSANRTAISLPRATARTRRRLATLAQMIPNSTATPIISVSNGSSNAARTADKPRFPAPMGTSGLRARNVCAIPPGACAAMVRMMNGPMSARACSRVTSGASRPISNSQIASGRSRRRSFGLRTSCIAIGTQRSGATPTASPVKDGGATPMIVRRASLTTIALPTMDESCRNRRVQ